MDMTALIKILVLLVGGTLMYSTPLVFGAVGRIGMVVIGVFQNLDDGLAGQLADTDDPHEIKPGSGRLVAAAAAAPAITAGNVRGISAVVTVGVGARMAGRR